MADLLDMAMPGMGTNFADMANASRPQMMPEAPSPVQAGMYGMDMARHDAMLKQAATLAQLDAVMKGRAAERDAAMQPGRMAEIDTANTMAQGRQGDLPTMLATQSAKTGNALAGEEVKKVKDEVAKLDPFINAWDKATPEEKPHILKAMKDAGAKFGSVSLGDMSVEEGDQMMGMLRHAQANTPTIFGEETKGQFREGAASITAGGRVDVQKLKNDSAAKLKQMGIEAPHYNDVYNQLAAKAAMGSLTEQEQKTLNWLAAVKMETSQARVDTAKPNVTIEGGKVVSTPPSTTPLPQIEVPRPAANDSIQVPVEGTTVSIPKAAITGTVDFSKMAADKQAAATAKFKSSVAAAKGDKAILQRIVGDWVSTFSGPPPN